MSSGEKAWDGWFKTSLSMELVMTSLAGAPVAIASADASIWNRNGTGSSSWGKEEDEGWKTSSYGETRLWSEPVYESF